MRIGIVCEGETNARQGFETVESGRIGEVVVYKTEISKKGGKRRFARRLKRCAQTMRELGIGMCAANEQMRLLQNFGLTVFSSGTRIFCERAGDMALDFADAHDIKSEFLIIGGSFGDVVRAAEKILSRRRYLYIENAAFEEISGYIFGAVGVSVSANAPADVVELRFCEEENFLSWGEKRAHFLDFKTSLPGGIFENIPEGIRRPLAEMLEISGVLQKNEIKVEYFPKENF